MERNPGLPFADYQYVDVVFNAIANGNTDIRHDLSAPAPEDVDFQAVRWNFTSAPGTTPVIYRDTSATRRPWGNGYIVLRCNVASASATILLTVRS